MLYTYPTGTVVTAVKAYIRPYDDPIAVATGDAVLLDPAKSATTDIIGWVWCTGPDGRAGWTPEAWLELRGGQWIATRDFSALELTVEPGERFKALFGESGFLFVENARGERGWLPDGTVALAADEARGA